MSDSDGRGRGEPDARTRRWAGLLATVLGVMILLRAFGLGPMAAADVNGPLWIIGFAGLFLAGCGVLLFEPPPALGRAIGATVVGTAIVVFGWIALFADAAHFTTNIPFVSRETAVLCARIGFAACALLAAVIAFQACRRGGRSSQR